MTRKSGVVKQHYDDAVAVAKLHPHPKNPNNGRVDMIADSIIENGFFGCVLAQESSGTIIAGQHRWEAATEEGLATIPVLWLDVDDDRAERIMLVANATARAGEDDQTRLDAILAELAATDIGLAGTGWGLPAVDAPEPPTVEEVELRPIRRGHFLISYPLDQHDVVADTVGALTGHEGIDIRHSAN